MTNEDNETILFDEILGLRIICILLLLALLFVISYTLTTGQTNNGNGIHSSSSLKRMLDTYATNDKFQYGPITIHDNMTVRDVKLTYLYYKTNPTVDRYLDYAVIEICK